jgi:hypothetical protein
VRIVKGHTHTSKPSRRLIHPSSSQATLFDQRASNHPAVTDTAAAANRQVEVERELPKFRAPARAALERLLRSCLRLRADMGHFATNMRTYVTYEVLEGEGAGGPRQCRSGASGCTVDWSRSNDRMVSGLRGYSYVVITLSNALGRITTCIGAGLAAVRQHVLPPSGLAALPRRTPRPGPRRRRRHHRPQTRPLCRRVA